MRRTLIYIIVLSGVFAAAGCKRTKDTFTSRFYHNMVSKFNPLFNGEQAFLKAEAALNQLHKDDFDEILPVFRLGDEQLVSNVKPDLEKAIEKGSKVIQQHSMMIRNSQKNKFIDDSYLLVGKSRFLQQDYIRALETFNYIIQEYPSSKAVYEARLYAARSKVKIGNLLAAKEDYEKLYRESEMPKKLKDDVYASYAQLEINSKNYQGAYQLLRQAIERADNKQDEVRWMFISGQLQEKMGNDFEASEIFRRVIKKGPPYELLFQAQLNRARSYDVQLQDPTRAFEELEDMLKDDKNYDNRDQIYYVMALLAEKLDDEAKVEEYLKKSIRVSTNNHQQKALSYLKLADINFTNRLYPTAAAYYDSTYSNLNRDDPRYKIIEKKKKSLDELVKNLNVIEEQDSLQTLAALPESERLERIDKHIRKLKEAEEQERLESEQPLNNFAFDNSTTQNNPTTSRAGGSWYFYNQNLRSVGITDFTTRFGNRKLEDNWRRKSKESVSNFGEPEGEETGSGQLQASGGAETGEGTTYTREQFLTGIPLDEASLKASHNLIIDAHMNIGRIYKDELKDLQAASKTLEDLLKRYPEMEDKGRVWYTLYRIYTIMPDEQNAKVYRDLILGNLPESEYAKLINNAGSTPETGIDEVETFYVSAYQEYKSEGYRNSLKLSKEGVEKYGNSAFAPKFYLLRAFNEVKLGQKEEFIKTLKLVSDQFSTSEEAEEARNILAQLDEGGNEESGEAEAEANKTGYALASKNVQHKYVVVVPNKGTVVNDLRIDLSDFNNKYFSIDNLNTKSVMLNNDYQIILVSNFNNAARAMDYYETINRQQILGKHMGAGNLRHFVISSDNFQKYYGAKDSEEYLDFFRKHYISK